MPSSSLVEVEVEAEVEVGVEVGVEVEMVLRLRLELRLRLGLRLGLIKFMLTKAAENTDNFKSYFQFFEPP